MALLDPLRAQHRELLSRLSGDRSGLLELLREHQRAEEEALRPLRMVLDPLSGPLADRALEWADILALAESGEPGLDDLLLRHVQREESGLFPLLERLQRQGSTSRMSGIQ
ncbi:MAG: hypothetical protein AB1758_03480 [Candidatus Eremiobacterota bacterium]